MPITEADVEKVAQLAHLEITPAELKIFAPQMADIVSYVEQLNEVATGNVPPALGGLTPAGEATDSARDDVRRTFARPEDGARRSAGCCVRSFSSAEGAVNAVGSGQ